MCRVYAPDIDVTLSTSSTGSTDSDCMDTGDLFPSGPVRSPSTTIDFFRATISNKIFTQFGFIIPMIVETNGMSVKVNFVDPGLLGLDYIRDFIQNYCKQLNVICVFKLDL